MKLSDFKTELKNNTKVVVYYTACQYRWKTSADPEMHNLDYFLDEPAAIEYAKSINLFLGFYPKVEKVLIDLDFIDLEEEEDFELNTIQNIVKHNGSWVDVEEVWCGSENLGNNIDGAIILEWTWEKYPGYCRNLKQVGTAGQWPFQAFKNESDLITGNEGRTFRSNYSVLLMPEEFKGLSKEEFDGIFEEKIRHDNWKWSYFRDNPNTVKF